MVEIIVPTHTVRQARSSQFGRVDGFEGLACSQLSPLRPVMPPSATGRLRTELEPGSVANVVAGDINRSQRVLVRNVGHVPFVGSIEFRAEDRDHAPSARCDAISVRSVTARVPPLRGRPARTRRPLAERGWAAPRSASHRRPVSAGQVLLNFQVTAGEQRSTCRYCDEQRSRCVPNRSAVGTRRLVL